MGLAGLDGGLNDTKYVLSLDPQDVFPFRPREVCNGIITLPSCHKIYTVFSILFINFFFANEPLFVALHGNPLAEAGITVA